MPKWVIGIWSAGFAVLWWLDWAGANRTLVFVGNLAFTVGVLYSLYTWRDAR